MQVAIRNTARGTWFITPTSGMFNGVAVAEAEGVALVGAVSTGKTLIGAAKALWGATILAEGIYEDRETRRALAFTGVFPQQFGERMRLDYDGLRNAADEAVERAANLVAFKDNIYGKGLT